MMFRVYIMEESISLGQTFADSHISLVRSIPTCQKQMLTNLKIPNLFVHLVFPGINSYLMAKSWIMGTLCYR